MKISIMFAALVGISGLSAGHAFGQDATSQMASEDQSGAPAPIPAHILNESAANLGQRICTQLQVIQSNGDTEGGLRVEDLILRRLNITRETPNYQALVATYWNANKDAFICHEREGYEIPGTRSPQHFMKRVVDLRMERVVFGGFLLSSPERYPIDVNAVEYYNGEPETLLDYLDDIMANQELYPNRYDYRKVRSLRRHIINTYGAMTAEQLGL